MTGSGATFWKQKIIQIRSEGLDIAELQVLLIAEDSAKTDLYKYIDVLYRDPRNRLSAHMAIVEGELAPYFEPKRGHGNDISTYYTQLIDTAIRYTLVPKVDIQQALKFFLQKISALALPILKSEKKAVYPKSPVLRYLMKRRIYWENFR